MDVKQKFLEILLQTSALQFGSFKTKSGRNSPYFFNTGKFCSGRVIHEVGEIYANAYLQRQLGEEYLFGPAYKGIPLATSMASALWRLAYRDVKVSYNRKEQKDHGEGGSLVGSPLEGDVLIVEDVLTGGTSVKASLELFSHIGAKAKTVLVGIDRQERGSGLTLAHDELTKKYDLRVHAIITLDDIIERLFERRVLDRIWIDKRQKELIDVYRIDYGPA